MAVQDRKAREFSRREDEILQAALGLFQSDNWQSITVEQIAREADVGKGTIYKHFTSKDDIYAHLAMKFQRQILSEFGKIERDQPVLEQLRQHLACAWHMHLSSKELHRVFLYCSRTEFRTQMTPNQLSELMDVEAQVARPTRALILEGIEQGLFPRKTPALLVFGAQSAFWGAIQVVWSGYLGDIDPDEYLNALTAFIFAGLIYHDRQFTSLAVERKHHRPDEDTTVRAHAHQAERNTS